MRSQQDGFYLVEFIHGANVLSQVILLTSGPHSNARHNSSPWSPPNPLSGPVFLEREQIISDFQKLNVPSQNYAFHQVGEVSISVPVLAMPAPTTSFFLRAKLI